MTNNKTTSLSHGETITIRPTEHGAKWDHNMHRVILKKETQDSFIAWPDPTDPHCSEHWKPGIDKPLSYPKFAWERVSLSPLVESTPVSHTAKGVSGLSACAVHEYDYPVSTPWNPECYISNEYVERWTDIAFVDPFAMAVPCWQWKRGMGCLPQRVIDHLTDLANS